MLKSVHEVPALLRSRGPGRSDRLLASRQRRGAVVEGVRPGQGQQDWDSGQERRAFTEMLEQIRFADSLGFDYAFLGAHHLMPEYAHNSATEVQFGVLAATTRNIRLGTGIVHASHNDPVRVRRACRHDRPGLRRPCRVRVRPGQPARDRAVPEGHRRLGRTLGSGRADRGGHPEHQRCLAGHIR
jgi:hypothetical protein